MVEPPRVTATKAKPARSYEPSTARGSSSLPSGASPSFSSSPPQTSNPAREAGPASAEARQRRRRRAAGEAGWLAKLLSPFGREFRDLY
ncbi:hypothetical protein E2320_019460 [Naja naja]|nr:hypothetical protein E2320_019460 [Naja naja]